ncbi:PREDICTED: transcription factor SOX-4 isoform X2 [Camelina sativa]|uniref:Transcription factor SOX-4 isoform X2 n=1 Tax=Camelina sativa TaxID=90675 RepID=A0ABM1RJA9_CAMSA|nr:PREDICTED: transcription factor SOX-4 isoform X2 [Camelina sativa]
MVQRSFKSNTKWCRTGKWKLCLMYPSECFVLQNVIDLLNPPAELEKRKHKLKRLVQSPNSFFMHSPEETRKQKNMSDPSGQSSTTTVGGNGGGSSGSNGGGGGGSGGSFGNQPQRSKVRKQVWAGVLGISSSTNN